MEGFDNPEPPPRRRMKRIVAIRRTAYQRPEPLTPHERHERIERYTRRAAAKLPLNGSAGGEDSRTGAGSGTDLAAGTENPSGLCGR